jgi:hypothetical protein
MTLSSFIRQVLPDCRLFPEKDHISQTRREMSKMQGEDALCLWLASSELSRIATRHSRRK